MDKYIGKMLDNRYEILEQIGAGGMAVVYKAKCHRLNRYVAIKILKDEYANDEDFRQRFHAESQAIAMFSHPNIVSVYDVSRSSDVEYIVMELIDGMTLKQYMQKKGVLSWREALHFTTQIVKALEHAHSCGIIHRDIKPHNIMVLRDGSVRVADFGIARVASSQNTLTQEALGSVHYISPEQAKGARVDARTDIYSVGVVMYEMLTGRLPYEGDSPVAVAIQHISSMPVFPRELNPEIPEGLEKITMKAMCADVDKRYASAAEMYSDLEEFRKNPDVNFDYDVVVDSAALLEVDKKNAAASRRAAEESRRLKELEDDKHRDSKRRASKVSILAGVLAVLVFCAGVFIFLWDFFIQDLFTVEDEVKVPSIVSRDINYAIDNFKDFDIVVSEYKESSVYTKAGTIIEQDVDPGTTVKVGSTIKVVVSTGSVAVEMPALAGHTRAEAERELNDLLKKVSFTISSVNVETDAYEPDTVVETIPAAGETIRDGATITLRISIRTADTLTVVPGVVGKSEAEAVELLKESELRSSVVEAYSDTVEAGFVIFQNYSVGSDLEKNTVVTIRVSLGPEPEPETPTVAEPQPEPETPPNGETPASGTLKSMDVTIPLPVGEGEVSVEVFLDGNSIFLGTMEKSEGSFTRIVQGSGLVHLEVFYDGVSSYRVELDFDAHGY